MRYRPTNLRKVLQTLTLGRNASLTVWGFSLDANGAFRPEQSGSPYRPVNLRPGHTLPIIKLLESSLE